MIIVDTDILIDAARKIEDAVTCLQQIEDKSSPAISAVTQMELIIGCRNKKELKSLEHFLQGFKLISLNKQISDTAADLLKTYRLSHGMLIASRCPDRGHRYCYRQPANIQEPEGLQVYSRTGAFGISS